MPMSSEVERYKDQGNVAFKKGRYLEAIDAYTKAIALDETNHTFYSNRSAAYLRSDQPEKALDDANICISLNRTYHKGYGRKGAAYHAMSEYSKAIAAYKEGLKVCHDEPNLQKGLAASKRAKLDNSKASKAVRKSQATVRAKEGRSKRAKKAVSVSTFVQQTQMELNLQIAALQAQLDLINELAVMAPEEKMDLLFSLIDRDGDGTVDARELAAALRKRNDELSFTDSIERAIDMVAVFDKDGDAKLDHEEFHNFINVMLKELDVDFDEFAEFLVHQILFKKSGNTEEEDMVGELAKAHIDEAVKEREELFDMLTDPRMIELFKLFDKEGTRVLTFAEVATGLFQITQSMDEAAKTTIGVLLMLDKRDARTLNYEQFGRLVMAIVAAANTDFDEVADLLTFTLTQQSSSKAQRAYSDLIVSDTINREATALAQELDDPAVSALSYGRLQRLFDLWDVNGDGDITFNELIGGVSKFQAAAGIVGNAENDARALLGFDEDGDQKLGRREFAKAMISYSKAFNVDLQELIDFMCVTSVLSEENTAGFQKAYGKSIVGGGTATILPAHMNYYEEDDNDDFFFM